LRRENRKLKEEREILAKAAAWFATESGPSKRSFGKRCQEAGVMPSMGSVGDAYDNAMADSFFATLERELLNRRRFRSQAEAKMAVFEWIEGWYNPRRRHSSLGYRSPVNYERAHGRSVASSQSFCRLAAADRAAG
jgi:transposase InsO family protein